MSPTNSLPYVVHIVRDLQLRHLFLQLLGQLLGGEAHGIDVVGPHAQRVGRRLHHLKSGTQTVIDVHHGQSRVVLQVAFELSGFDRIMEDLDGVVWMERKAKLILKEYVLFMFELFCDMKYQRCSMKL